MLNAVILIGGKSERMGTDKYQLKVHDQPQYVHLYEMLSRPDIKPHLSCNKDQDAKIPDNYHKIIDQHEGIGPIGGLISAIQKDPKTPILLIACDLINLTENTIRQLIENNHPDHDVVTYHKQGTDFKETTCTIYNLSSFKYVSELVEQGAYSLLGILEKSKVKSIAVDDNEALKNVNTRDDL